MVEVKAGVQENWKTSCENHDAVAKTAAAFYGTPDCKVRVASKMGVLRMRSGLYVEPTPEAPRVAPKMARSHILAEHEYTLGSRSIFEQSVVDGMRVA